MKKAALVASSTFALFLAGCGPQNLSDGTQHLCKYAPALDAAQTLMNIFFPAAGGVFSSTQIAVGVKAVCKAVEEAKSKKGFVSPKKIAVWAKGPDGKSTKVVLNGKFVE